MPPKRCKTSSGGTKKPRTYAFICSTLIDIILLSPWVCPLPLCFSPLCRLLVLVPRTPKPAAWQEGDDVGPQDLPDTYTFWTKAKCKSDRNLASYFLSVPATNVVCESAFSVAANVLSPRRKNTGDETLEMRTTLKYNDFDGFHPSKFSPDFDADSDSSSTSEDED